MADVSSGYLQRGIARFPRAGTRGPWTMMAYEKDVARLREGPAEDAALRFATSRPAELAARPEDHALAPATPGSFARMDVGI